MRLDRITWARRIALANSYAPPVHSLVLVAPDSFKGTISAPDVAAAVARGLRAGGRDALELPLGDGGEGTMDVLLVALGGEVRTATVSDPLGRPVEARFALIEDGRRAVVEMAAASGLRLVAERDRDAWAASTRGTGELIVAACEAGAREVLVCAGGSATTDGGAGAVSAIESAGISPRLVVACDVRTPWEDAAPVFGPQKGADPKTVKRLRRRMATLAGRAPRDPRGVAMTGAAGGLAGGLYGWCGAQLVAGAPYVLDEVGFDGRMRGARFVITGEGRLDEQTLAGKLVAEVATRCRQGGVGCHAVVGQNALDEFRTRILDLGLVIEAGDEAALEAAGRRLAEI
jgi:glycerate kinase